MAADFIVDAEWPPVGRGPTRQELDDGVAVVHDDRSVSWSPTADNFDWTDEDEARSPACFGGGEG